MYQKIKLKNQVAMGSITFHSRICVINHQLYAPSLAMEKIKLKNRVGIDSITFQSRICVIMHKLYTLAGPASSKYLRINNFK